MCFSKFMYPEFMARLLIVEDNKIDQRIYRKLLGAQHELYFHEHALGVTELFEKIKPELVILDFHLYEGDGVQVYSALMTLEDVKRIPIFFVSASSDADLKLKTLSMGAHDYLSKPFNYAELRLKIENAIQRSKWAQQNDSSVLRIANICYHDDSQSLELITGPQNDSRKVELTRSEAKLFKLLATNAGRVMTRNQILDKIWGEGVHVVDRVIDNQVSALRKKLGPFASCLKSVYGSGYLLDPKSLKI